MCSHEWYCSCCSLVSYAQIVCLYFFNHIYTELEIWYKYGHGFPYFNLVLLPASMLVAFNVQTVIFGSILAFIAACDTGAIVWNQFMVGIASLFSCQGLVHLWVSVCE